MTLHYNSHIHGTYTQYWRCDFLINGRQLVLMLVLCRLLYRLPHPKHVRRRVVVFYLGAICVRICGGCKSWCVTWNIYELYTNNSVNCFISTMFRYIYMFSIHKLSIVLYLYLAIYIYTKQSHSSEKWQSFGMTPFKKDIFSNVVFGC